MKYLSDAAIQWAIDRLRKRSHPFLGITFLACKSAGLPVGSTARVRLDRVTREHLDRHHRLAPQSDYYFQPFGGKKAWAGPKYPSKGLQSFNTGKFGRAFRHPGGTQEWGFVENYVDEIADVGRYALDIQAISVWVLKDRKWSDRDTLATVIDCFLESYRITKYERNNLFSMDGFGMADESVNGGASHRGIFDERPPDLIGIAFRYGAPPDNKVDKKRSRLLGLELSDVGPSEKLSMDLGERLTLIAGDNGLGKSFILDVVWWAITGNWFGRPALPFDALRNVRRDVTPTIKYKIGMDEARGVTVKGCFDRHTHSWVVNNERPRLSSLCIFVRVDGSFAVADEMRARLGNGNRSGVDCFTGTEVWDGKPGEIEGVVRDWIAWQRSPDRETFSKLEKVLRCLSPDDLGCIAPGEPARLPGDPRLIPTVVHPYGTVPVVFSSAGVQNILLLTYMMVWVWHEHKLAARQLGEEPCGRMTIILDEVEAHLHPRWQRTVLPALMGIGDLLQRDLAVQVIASTHSPMVLASMETTFSDRKDLLYRMVLRNSAVVLEEMEFHKYGDVSAWLMSSVFGLLHARSREAEEAIEAAKKAQLASIKDKSEVENISNRLKHALAGDDPFWPRWIFFAEERGVSL